MLKRAVYWFTLLLAKLIFGVFFRMKVQGRDFVPKGGALIVAPSHASFTDPPAAAIALKMRRVTFMAKAFLFEPLFMGWLISTVGAFPLDKDGGEIAALRLSLKLLKEGRAVIIFPEGGRIRVDGLGKPEPGTGMLAVKSGAPVLPIYIHDSHDALKLLLKGKLPKISTYIAPPLRFPPAPKGVKKSEHYQQVSMAVMRELWRMRCWHRMSAGLPPEAPEFGRFLVALAVTMVVLGFFIAVTGLLGVVIRRRGPVALLVMVLWLVLRFTPSQIRPSWYRYLPTGLMRADLDVNGWIPGMEYIHGNPFGSVSAVWATAAVSLAFVGVAMLLYRRLEL